MRTDPRQAALFDTPDADHDAARLLGETWPPVVWALLDGVHIPGDAGWDGSNGLPAQPWEQPCTYVEYRHRLQGREVHQMPRLPEDVGFVVGRYQPTPKLGDEYVMRYWTGEPRQFDAAHLIDAAVFSTRVAALLALLDTMPAIWRSWEFNEMDRTFVAAHALAPEVAR